MNRKIFTLMVALMGGAVQAATVTSVSNWVHGWVDNNGFSTVSVPTGTQTVQIPTAKWNNQDVYLDASGQVYAGKPSTPWTIGTAPSSNNGVFVSLTGGILKARANSHVYVRNSSGFPTILLESFGFATNDNPNVWVSAELTPTTVEAGQTGIAMMVHYTVGRYDNSLPLDPATLPVIAGFYYDANGVVKFPVPTISLQQALAGFDQVIVANGQVCEGENTSNPFGANQIILSTETISGRDVLNVQVDPSNAGLTNVQPGQEWRCNSSINLGYWRDYSGFRAKFRNTNPAGNNGPLWKIWFFEEHQLNSDDLGIPRLPASKNAWITVHKTMADFGISGVSWGDSAVIGLKVMRDKSDLAIDAQERIELDTVVLERNQPSSFKVQVLNQIAPPTGFPLTVQVRGTGADQCVIRVLSSTGSLVTQASPASGQDTIHVDGLNGVYTISVDRAGFSYEPKQTVWQAGPSNLVMFQQYSGKAVFSPDPPQNIVMNEKEVKVLNLSSLATDFYNHLSLNWALDSVTGDKIPYKLDATLGQLTLGDALSFANGNTTLYLRATTRSGAMAHDSLKVQILPVNDPPMILAKQWGIVAGAVLDVGLDSVSNGQGVWVRDPDDGLLNLTWTATLDASSPAGASVAIQNRRLQLQAPANFTGEMLLHVTVSDLAGLVTKADIRIQVRPSKVSLFGWQTSQNGVGDLEIHFFSRFSIEPVSLPNGMVMLTDPATGGVGKVAARLDVLTAPGFKNGLWTDGEYKITIARGATWNGTNTKRFLVKLLSGYTSVSAQVPLAADGQTLSQQASFTPIDFKGPTALVSAEVVLLETDLIKRNPGLHVSWDWVATPGIPDRLVITRSDLPSDPPVVIALDPAQTMATVVGLQDSRTYTLTLEAHDQNGNPGGGSQSITTPSGIYQAVFRMNDRSLEQVTGSLCSIDDAIVSNCQKLSDSPTGTHTLGGLHNGLYSFFVDDPRWTGTGLSISAKIDHQDVTLDWNLIPKSVLVNGSASVEQDIVSGDLVVNVGVDHPFDNEQPTAITLTWLTTDQTGKATSHEVGLTVPKGGFSTNGLVWTMRWKRSELPAAALGPALLGNSDRKSLRALAVTTRLTTQPQGMLLRSDAIQIGTAKSPTAWRVWSFAPPPPEIDPSRSIDNFGRTTWEMTFGPVHGAVPRFHICRQEISDAPTCFDSVIQLKSDLLRFRPTALAAFGIPNHRSFEELPSGGAMRVPAGAGYAASQWKVWTSTAQTVDIWVNWTTPKISGEMGVSLDSGKTWPIHGYHVFEGWTFLGSISLNAGWNSLALLGSEGVMFQGVALVPSAGSPFSKPPVAGLPTLDQSAKGILSVPLVLDRAYQTQMTSTDAYGFTRSVADDFRVHPDGLLGDVLLTQEEGSGDLLLLAGETRISTKPGALQVRLAPGMPAITPASLDSVPGHGKLQIRLARKDIPSEFIASGLAKAPSLDSIRLITTLPVTYTWTERHCWHWGINCHSDVFSRTSNSTDSVSVAWTGFAAWHSVHDLRPLPVPTIEALNRGVDSIEVVVKGLDNDATSRGTAAGIATVTWTPGSYCAPSTRIKVPFKQVFATTATGAVAFRPLVSSASWSVLGDWTDSSDQTPRVRHQWLDVQQGGGFFPRQA